VRRRICCGLLAVLCAIPVVATTAPSSPNGVESLQRFFGDVSRFTAQFDQLLIDETGATIQESKGRLWIERPNKFRWDYETPYKQQIIGDGEKLWVYDEDLKQATVRSLKGGLLDTPAVLLAGQGRLNDQFQVRDDGVKNNLAWVELTPKNKDSGFEKVRLAFDNGRLREIELMDGLGQMTRYTLSGAVENKPIGAARFTFTPPPDVDVVGER
jgi:outer membrane lipoprotein carrier protein